MMRAPRRSPLATGGRWLLPALLSAAAILLSALVGALASQLSTRVAGREALIVAALLVTWLLILLCVTRYRFVAFACFSLFGFVTVEPAPSDGLILLLLVVGVVVNRLQLKSVVEDPLPALGLWGFLVANIVSIWFAGEMQASLRYLFITLYLAALVVFVKAYVHSSRDMSTILLGYVSSAAASVGLVLLGYLGVGSDTFLEFGTRAVALFKDANVFGPFLILPAMVLVDEILYPHVIKGWGWLKGMGALCMILGVLASGSRAAWINLFISLLIYAVLTWRTRHALVAASPGTPRLRMPPAAVTALAVVLVVTLLVLAPALGVPGAVEDFIDQRARTQLYDMSRFARQLEGLHAGLSHPLGVGPGMWSSAHSLYVRTFAEHGILGLGTLLFVIVLLLKRTLSTALREAVKPYGLSARVVFACLVGTLANSVVIDTVHWRHFWLLVALAWVLTTAPTGEPQGEAPPAGMEGDDSHHIHRR